jgi:hypothetical protein
MPDRPDLHTIEGNGAIESDGDGFVQAEVNIDMGKTPDVLEAAYVLAKGDGAKMPWILGWLAFHEGWLRTQTKIDTCKAIGAEPNQPRHRRDDRDASARPRRELEAGVNFRDASAPSLNPRSLKRAYPPLPGLFNTHIGLEFKHGAAAAAAAAAERMAELSR